MADKQVVLITGSNKGIGLALARQYSEAGYKVIAVVRNVSEELKQVPGVEIIQTEITQQSGIDKVIKELNGQKLNIVLNNAGVFPSDNLETLTFESLNQGFLLNTAAPLVLTSALSKDNLLPGSKIIFISSALGSIGDLNTRAFLPASIYSYRISKSAINSGAHNLSWDLKSREIIVSVIHPGLVETDMSAGMGAKEGDKLGTVSTQTSAEKIRLRISELTLETSGSFYDAITGAVIPW